MASKYTFHFADNTKIVQERRGGESDRHIVLKLLGYMLYYEQRPRIEIPVGLDRRGYRPDVVAFDANGSVTLWVDCGQITLRKVDDLTRQRQGMPFVIIKAARSEMEGYALQAAKKVKRLDLVLLLSFDPDFVPSLIAALGHNNHLTWTREGSALCVTLNGTEYVTTLWRWDNAQGCAVPADSLPGPFIPL